MKSTWSRLTDGFDKVNEKLFGKTSSPISESSVNSSADGNNDTTKNDHTDQSTNDNTQFKHNESPKSDEEIIQNKPQESKSSEVKNAPSSDISMNNQKIAQEKILNRMINSIF
jgi:hypothetical protein